MSCPDAYGVTDACLPSRGGVAPLIPLWDFDGRGDVSPALLGQLSDFLRCVSEHVGDETGGHGMFRIPSKRLHGMLDATSAVLRSCADEINKGVYVSYMSDPDGVALRADAAATSLASFDDRLRRCEDGDTVEIGVRDFQELAFHVAGIVDECGDVLF